MFEKLLEFVIILGENNYIGLLGLLELFELLELLGNFGIVA